MAEGAEEVDALMSMPVEDLARSFAKGDPDGRGNQLRRQVLEARLLAASIDTARATGRLATWTFVLAIATAALAVATVAVALLTR